MIDTRLKMARLFAVGMVGRDNADPKVKKPRLGGQAKRRMMK